MDKVAQCTERLVDVGARARAVDLVEVDVIGFQAAEARLALRDHPAAGAALAVGAFAHLTVELRGEHDLLPGCRPGLGQEIAHYFFGFSGRVDVGRVDEVDAGAKCVPDDAVALARSAFPHPPNIIAPNKSGLTSTPVRPKVR